MHSHPPLRVVWKSSSTKRQGKCGADHPPACAVRGPSEHKANWKPNAQGFLFVTRNGRPPSSNKVVEYQLWADSRCSRNRTLWAPCVPSFGRFFHRGCWLLRRGSAAATPSLERSHNSRLYAFPRGSPSKHGGRFKLSKVGRSWTRHTRGSQYNSVACGASDMGSIPIARSMIPQNSC